MARTKIQDEFSNLPISRQRKYQLRMQRDQRCTECGEPAVLASRCLKHLVKARERQRQNRGLTKRYYGTISYRLETGSDGLEARVAEIRKQAKHQKAVQAPARPRGRRRIVDEFTDLLIY